MRARGCYYGVQRHVALKMNELLALPATGNEQDWEIELSDPAKIDRMIKLFEQDDMDLDHRSALAAIAIASLDEAIEDGASIEQNLSALGVFLERDELLRERMRFYWTEFYRGINPVILRALFDE